MKAINFVQVPSSKLEDDNLGKTIWKDDKYISLDEGKNITIFIGHYTEGSGENIVTRAYPIRLDKPITRDKAINSAEMEAYSLNSAMDVASFNASLSKKFREDPEDKEVKDHDELINWVRKELTKIGIV